MAKNPNIGRSVLQAGGTIDVRPGYIIVDTSTATGGITYIRRIIDSKRINHGEGVRSKLETTKTVDHEEAVAAVDAVVKRADYICRKFCTRTAFGWFCDADGLARVSAEIDKLRVEAQEANERAAAVGSLRRAHVGIVPAALNVASADAAREIARTVRDVLSEVLAALRAGDFKALHAPLLRCKNLENLAVGPAFDAIKFALDRIAPAKQEIRAAAHKELAAKPAADDAAQVAVYAKAGAAADLEAIEAAIAWFQPGGLAGEDAEGSGAAIASAMDA